MCYWHRPVCAKCKIDMYPEKNGVPFVEQYPVGNEMKPYKIWETDMWKCSGCGASVLVGFGKGPTAVCHDETFDAALAVAKEDEYVVIEQERLK